MIRHLALAYLRFGGAMTDGLLFMENGPKPGYKRYTLFDINIYSLKKTDQDLLQIANIANKTNFTLLFGGGGLYNLQEFQKV